MTNFNTLPSTIRSRAGLPLRLLGAAVLIAGCGSSGSEHDHRRQREHLGQRADHGRRKSEHRASASTTATTATTPTSGALSKEPTVTPPVGRTPTKLVTKDLIVGTGPEAKAGETVTVNYVGVLFKGGKEFDASWKRNEPFTFTLGKGQVIPGWDQRHSGHEGGRTSRADHPAALAYGAAGSPPTIPPNATLVFVVDLLGV